MMRNKMAARSIGLLSRKINFRSWTVKRSNLVDFHTVIKRLDRNALKFTGLASPSLRSFCCGNLLQRTVSSQPSKSQCWKCGAVPQLDQKTYQYTCSQCKVLLPPDPDLNYFAVLGFDVTFDIDIMELSNRFKELQKIFHPDKFSLKTEQEQEFSASHSSQVNKAYQTLLKPLSRGVYMLELNGHPFEEQGFDMDQTFLMDVMRKNEELDEVTSIDELSKLASENCSLLEECIREASAAFNQKDFEKAKHVIAKLKYFDNIDGKAKDKLLQLKLQ